MVVFRSLVRIPARIRSTGRWRGGRTVPTRELVERAMPDRDPERIEARVGISSRRWAAPETTIAQMGAAALSEALERADLPPEALGRIVLTCSTGGDLLIPCAAVDVAHRLGLRDHALDTFDLANSCNGFISALDLTARSASSTVTAILAVEQFSRFVREEEPRCFVIFGDAAVAAILDGDAGDGGIAATSFRTVTSPDRRIDVPHPARTHERAFIDFRDLDSDFLTGQALDAMGRAMQDALARAEITLPEVDWVLTHQPNAEMVERFRSHFDVAKERMVPITSDNGSIGSAAVPMSLDALHRSGRLASGQHVLMASVGSGTVAGAVVYRVP
ncbi:MAG: 3-oxoacyl-[acyl-carrier-protein] synthase III C-terminal domain-containing protein [Deltaproteobacteria bacterium]